MKIKELLRRLFAINDLLSRVIIIVCIGYMIRVVERCMTIMESTGVSAHNMIQSAALFFGGELMMLIAKKLSENRRNAKEKRGAKVTGKIDSD